MVTTPLQWLAPINVSTTASDENFSSVTQLTNGNIVVAYTTNSAAAPSDDPGTDILLRIYNPLGEPLGDPILLNTYRNADDESSVSIAALPGGGFIATYLDLNVISSIPVTYDTDVIFQVFDADGTSIENGTVINSAPELTLRNLDPQVAAISGTQAMAAWTDVLDGDVEVATINPSTGAVGAPITVFNGATGAGEGLRGLSITALPAANRYVVAWGNLNNGSNDEVEFQIIDSFGNDVGNPVTVDDTLSENWDPAVTVLTNGNFVVSWSNGAANAGIRDTAYHGGGRPDRIVGRGHPGRRLHRHLGRCDGRRPACPAVQFRVGRGRVGIPDPDLGPGREPRCRASGRWPDRRHLDAGSGR
jgi:hypothetical protein